MKTIITIITEATWAADEKSVTFFTNEVENNARVHGSAKQQSVVVGEENWEEENEEACIEIISEFLKNQGMEIININNIIIE